MTDIFNNLFNHWEDPFTHDTGDYHTYSITHSKPKPYYYLEPDYAHIVSPLQNWSRAVEQSNVNGNYIVIKTGGSDLPEIKDVIFNPPATIVLWKDGTKTVVKCDEKDTYSKETGLALAICKKAYGNIGAYNDVFNKWIK